MQPTNRRTSRTPPQTIALALLAVCIPRVSVEADIIKGSLVFDDNAFADTATMIVGSIDDFSGPATTLEEAITGPNLGAGFEIGEFNDGEIVEVGFLDNAIVNWDGPDLVVYEAHNADGFDVAVSLPGDLFSSFIHFEPVYQGFIENGYQNAALVDLSDYGLVANSLVSVIRIGEDDYDSAEITGIGALHSVPEPATVLLLMLGGATLASHTRGLRRTRERVGNGHGMRRIERS